jgi:hypothetical protein
MNLSGQLHVHPFHAPEVDLEVADVSQSYSVTVSWAT